MSFNHIQTNSLSSRITGMTLQSLKKAHKTASLKLDKSAMYSPVWVIPEILVVRFLL